METHLLTVGSVTVNRESGPIDVGGGAQSIRLPSFVVQHLLSALPRGGARGGITTRWDFWPPFILWWFFTVAESNLVPGKKVMETLKCDLGVEDTGNLWSWGHSRLSPPERKMWVDQPRPSFTVVSNWFGAKGSPQRCTSGSVAVSQKNPWPLFKVLIAPLEVTRAHYCLWRPILLTWPIHFQNTVHIT